MNEREPKIGDLILVNSKVVKITSITDFAPGDHPDSPIRNDLTARRYSAAWGDRWSGIREDGTAYAAPLTMGRPVNRVVLLLDDEWLEVLATVILDQVEDGEVATLVECEAVAEADIPMARRR